MPDLGLDVVLFAEGVGLALLHRDGRQEPLAEIVDVESVLAAWREWSRRIYPEGPVLYRLDYPPGGWGSNYVLRREGNLRLDAAYGAKAVEAAIQRIMAGIEPAVAAAEMRAGR